MIDPLAHGVWDEMSGLAPIFADQTIVKIGHSIGGLDVRCLHRDFGIVICNAFDTYEASRVLNVSSHGLAAVCQHYGLQHSQDYKDLKDIYQTTDWRQRPLSKPMILYGRYDVHYLIQLRTLMMRDLTHCEIVNDDYAESKLVAESLAATLQQIQAYEDGDDFEQFTSGSAYLSVPEENAQGQEQGENGANGDIDSGEDGGNTEDGYYTPMQLASFDDYEETADTIERDKNAAATENIATAETLRMQPRLMRVISWSQERCKDLWSGCLEPHFKNPVFVALVQRGKQQNKKQQQRPLDPMSQSQIQLYEDLVRLRAQIAKREECLPGFVCLLDDLALIASERPTNVDALRLINFFLPEMLAADGSNDSFMKQIFVLTKKSLASDGVKESRADSAVCRLYGKDKGGWATLRKASTIALATVICGSIVYAAVIMVRRRRK